MEKCAGLLLYLLQNSHIMWGEITYGGYVMQALVLITNHLDCVTEILAKFLENGIPGASIFQSHGTLQVLNEESEDPPSVFGSLRAFLNPRYPEGRMVLAVMQDEKIPVAKQIIRDVIGDISGSNHGIMFTIPVNDVEGMVKS
jgi:hypothetical protein